MTLVVILAGFVLVVVLAMVLVAFVAVRLARRTEPEPPPSPSGLSPDGNWWWDGTQWLPSGRTSIPPVNRPG